MASDRINYGIDLGTTNSAIVRMKRGQPVVLKNDFQGDTTPSAVAFGPGGRIRVGELAYNQLGNDRLRALRADRELRNVFVEFKRTMGVDHEYIPSVDPSAPLTSEKLSAEVLKDLKRWVTDAQVNAAVVTIPAAFIVPQQQATLRAAELAGLQQCHLLQEPVAAAMAYGLLEAEHANEKWLVFDFGGGTFDAALALVEDGQITVKDTEGDNHLGGKDLDQAVVEKIMLKEVALDVDIEDYIDQDSPRGIRFRDALKRWAEQANIRLSSLESHHVFSDLGDIELTDGRGIELDFEITRESLRPVVGPIFQRAIDKAKILLARNGLSGSDLNELILVGGPTFSPILREMLSEQVRPPNTSVDPMTVVAKGAALYASTVALDRALGQVSHSRSTPERSVLKLDVGYEATSISVDEFATVKCENPSDLSRYGSLTIELVRSGTGWRSGKHPLSEQGALLELKLEENRVNVFDLVVAREGGDPVATHPSEITIIQGTKVTGSPLTNNLGVEVWDKTEEFRIFVPLKGAEKTKPLPVTGIKTGLSTDSQIRPGVSGDRLLIRIYEGEADALGVPVALCSQVMALTLTGDQVNRVIPAGTGFELTVITQASSSIPEVVRLLFPTLDDEEYELPIPSNLDPIQMEWVDDELAEAHKRMSKMRDSGQTHYAELDEIESNIEGAKELLDRAGPEIDQQRKAVNRLKEALRGLYNFLKENSWPNAEAELDKAWADLNTANLEEGFDASRREIQEASQRFIEVKNSQDAGLARELISEFRRLTFMLKRCEWSKEIVNWAHSGFGRIRWTNSSQARHAVNEGMGAMLANRPCPELLDHARQILELVVRESPDDPRPQVPHLDTHR